MSFLVPFERTTFVPERKEAMPNMDVGFLLLIVISAFVALFLTLYFLLRRRKRNNSETAAGVSLSHLFAPALLGI